MRGIDTSRVIVIDIINFVINIPRDMLSGKVAGYPDL